MLNNVKRSRSCGADNDHLGDNVRKRQSFSREEKEQTPDDGSGCATFQLLFRKPSTRRSRHWIQPKLTVDRSKQLHMVHIDITDAFDNLAIPPELQQYFALSPVPAHLLGITHIGPQPISHHAFISPCMSVLPMGWSRATYFYQKVL